MESYLKQYASIERRPVVILMTEEGGVGGEVTNATFYCISVLLNKQQNCTLLMTYIVGGKVCVWGGYRCIGITKDDLHNLLGILH